MSADWRGLQIIVALVEYLGLVCIRYIGSADHLHAWAHVLTVAWIALCLSAVWRRRA